MRLVMASRAAIFVLLTLATLTLAPAAQANRTAPTLPAAELAAPQAPELAEATLKGHYLVCVFPDADGGCSGAVLFRIRDDAPARPDKPSRRPAPSSRSNRPASS